MYHADTYILHTEAEKAGEEHITQDAYFLAYYDAHSLTIELKAEPNTAFMLYFEFQPMWPAPGIQIQNGELSLANWALTHQSVFGEKIDQELERYTLMTPKPGRYVLTVSREKAGWTENVPIRFFVSANAVSWVKDDDPVHTLGKADTSPLEYGWLVPEGAMK